MKKCLSAEEVAAVVEAGLEVEVVEEAAEDLEVEDAVEAAAATDNKMLALLSLSSL